MEPIVRVVGHSIFYGVPDELVGDPGNVTTIGNKGQDKGTTTARLIECAGRTCYDSYGTGRSSAEYHNHIKEVGHGSVLEHASISFYIDNISRGCSHELVRHRSGCAISQRSTRYVDESDSPWALHPLWLAYTAEVGKAAVDADVAEHMLMAREVYDDMVNVLQTWLIGKGCDKLTARKQARGAARGMLGNALVTSMVWTANIRALRNVIEQRASQFADAEIRLLANRLYEKAVEVCPEYFDDYEKVVCPDGIGYGLVTKYRKI